MSTNDDTRRADEIEQDIERTRADVSSTIDAIQSRLSPGELMDQAIQYVRNSGTGDFGNNLGRTVRDNPVPVALIGVGIAWLAMGGTRRRTDLSPWDDAPAIRRGTSSTRWQEGSLGEFDDELGVESGWSSASGGHLDEPGLSSRVSAAGAAAGDSVRGTLSNAGSAMSDAASQVGDSVSNAAQRVKGTMSDAADRARDMAQQARERLAGAREDMRSRAGSIQGRAGMQVDRARESTMRMIDEQPLVLAAVGVAIGAALGAVLPSTRREDELLGGTADELKRGATDTVREQMGTVTQTAQRVAQTAREEVERVIDTPPAAGAKDGAGQGSGTSPRGPAPI